MDGRLLSALLNTGVLVAFAVGLSLYWRRQARLHPEALAPLPPLPYAAFVAADLVAERRRTAETLEQARDRLERVAHAFQAGASVRAPSPSPTSASKRKGAS